MIPIPLQPGASLPIMDNWSYARMALPANVEIDECLAMNPDGVITAVGCANTAAVDANGNSATTADIMLLVPVTLAVTATTVGKWNANNDLSLDGYIFAASATVPPNCGITLGGIWRDVHTIDTFGFADKTIMGCNCPWSTDTGAYQYPPNHTDSSGNLVWIGGDTPGIPANEPGEVNVFTSIVELYYARWFLALQVQGTTQIVAECDTGYTNVASTIYPGGVPTLARNAVLSKSDPSVGATYYGGKPNTPPLPRTPTNTAVNDTDPNSANAYVNNNANWYSNGGYATQYKKYYGK